MYHPDGAWQGRNLHVKGIRQYGSAGMKPSRSTSADVPVVFRLIIRHLSIQQFKVRRTRILLRLPS
jgi:hypothetical protein